MYDFVAATLCSGPARIGNVAQLSAASGDASALTMLTTSAPASRAALAESTRSGLCPDCEIARNNVRSRLRHLVWKIDEIDGECDATGVAVSISIRCFALVAA